MDIQFDSTFQPVGDQDASLNGQLGQIVCNGTKFPSHMDGYNWQLFDKPESLQATQLGYFQTYGGDAPQSAMYRHGVGWCGPITCIPSLNDGRDHSTSLGEVNAGACLKICENLKRELRAELTTHIEQMAN
ncbi:unnamed protein product [Camellia sinensis]